MITRDLECPIIVYNLQQDDVTGVISKILRTPLANPLSSMYDNRENKANIGYFRKNVIICLFQTVLLPYSINHSLSLAKMIPKSRPPNDLWVRVVKAESLSQRP